MKEVSILIEISNIRVEKVENGGRLCCQLKTPDLTKELWYQVNEENTKYLTYELADPFVVILLPMAIIHSWDIKVKDTPVSSKLLFGINHFIFPGLKCNSKVLAEGKEIFFGSNDSVATGMSCGVDSFYTYYLCGLNAQDDKLKIKEMTFFNVGAHDAGSPNEIRNLFLARSKKPYEVTKDLDLTFLLGDSNIHEILQEDFIYVHTFRNIGFALALQKKYHYYYYSSGHSVYEFDISKKKPAFFDLFLLTFLSNENITFISTGCVESRLYKLKRISEIPEAQHLLLVCFRDDHNCGFCEKCIRTLYGLWSIHKLDAFKHSFDLEQFYRNKKKLDVKFMSYVYNDEEDYKEIYQEIKKEHLKISFVIKIVGYMYHFARDYIKPLVKKWK